MIYWDIETTQGTWLGINRSEVPQFRANKEAWIGPPKEEAYKELGELVSLIENQKKKDQTELERKWEFVQQVSEICRENGLDEYMSQKPEKDTNDFRNWLRICLAASFKKGNTPEYTAEIIMDFIVANDTDL